jgi:hypothetical protein
MKLLSKEDILSADDSRTVVVDVPEWGGQVRLATMSGTSRDLYEQSLAKAMDNGKSIANLRASFLAYTLVDDEGSLLFTAGDIEALGRKSGAALDRIFQEASKLNRTGFSGAEEAAKN